MLFRIVYSSKSVGHVWLQVVEEIVLASLKNNPRHDITGCLCCSASEFLQVLEGPMDKVNTLLAIIEKDPRHRDVRVSERSSIEYRRFDTWAMGFAPRLPEHEPIFLRYMPHIDSSFDELGASDKLALLSDLIPVAEQFTDKLLHTNSLRPPK